MTTSVRPKLLDLFCGQGGCSAGYHRAGFDVVGVDISPQPRYPYEFREGDALEYDLSGFDAIHASPPCQAFSPIAGIHRAAGKQYLDLIEPTRRRLIESGVPWVIENVPGAPIRPDLKLCGCMFDLPHLRRERWFETNWNAFSLRAPCYHADSTITVSGHGGGADSNQRDGWVRAYGTTLTIEDQRRIMGIDWMSQAGLSQAIPPAYTEYIGEMLIKLL